jgi:hypothetical protein
MAAPAYAAADRAMRAVWCALDACPGLLAAVDDETIRDALQWNDANGDYDVLARADLLECFRQQQEYSR